MMTKPTRPMRDEPRNAMERELMDPESWDDEIIEGRTIGTPGAILRLHFTREEFLALDHLARRNGVDPIEYARLTVLRHLAGEDRKENATRQRRPA